ncbi:MAG: SH3 domain-containing protein [Anaerolineae bacterium]|nr:SH3 domain-containing protein [Anaerolineae bacterium]
MVDAKGLADGFIYLTDSFAPGSRTLVYVNTRDGLDAGIPLWVGSAGTSGVLAWVGDNSFNAQSDYEGWTQLAPPVYAVGGAQTIAPAPNQPLLVSPAQAASDSATPVFQRVLAVGSLAVINTTGGDQLNVRSGPGTNYQIVAKLGSGAQVTLMEGPTGGDGFTWWKIRTGSGISGWVVESVDDNGIRLQTLVPQ